MGAFGNLRGKGPFSMDAFDVFDIKDEDVPPATAADLFRNSRIGYTFTAGGRQWKVVRDNVGLGKRLIAPVEPRVTKVGGNYEMEGSYYAELDGTTLVVSNLAKRGEFRPVGRPVLRERLAGLGRR